MKSLFLYFKRARAILIANGMHFNIYSNNKYIVKIKVHLMVHVYINILSFHKINIF